MAKQPKLLSELPPPQQALKRSIDIQEVSPELLPLPQRFPRLRRDVGEPIAFIKKFGVIQYIKCTRYRNESLESDQMRLIQLMINDVIVQADEQYKRSKLESKLETVLPPELHEHMLSIFKQFELQTPSSELESMPPGPPPSLRREVADPIAFIENNGLIEYIKLTYSNDDTPDSDLERLMNLIKDDNILQANVRFESTHSESYALVEAKHFASRAISNLY
jgi:hypothetical protein